MENAVTDKICKATLTLNDWAGRVDVPVKVVGRTPKRIRVELLQDALMPGRRRGKAGETFLVPTYAVREQCAPS